MTPDFIIAGAPRSGTSALHRWLADHPDIGVGKHRKEIRYFTEHYDRGIDWYRDQISPGKVTGEATPGYMAHPEAPQRIAAHLPDVKLIFTFRDPVKRIYSAYWSERERGRGPDRFEDAIPDYLRGGYYAEHLERYRTYFEEEQLLAVRFEELTGDPIGTYRRVCEFVGADPDVVPESVGRKVNANVTFRSLLVRRLVRRLPDPLGKAVAKANMRHRSYPPMREDTERWLREHYAPHNRRLEMQLGWDLSTWAGGS